MNNYSKQGQGGSVWGAVRAGDLVLMVRTLERGERPKVRSVEGESGSFQFQTAHALAGFPALRVPAPVASEVVALKESMTSVSASEVSSPFVELQPLSDSVQGERLLVGLSATHMALRRMSLPSFLRHEQIRAILPQESVDILLERLEQPRFAFHVVPEPEGEGAQVFFAVCEGHLLTDLLESVVGMGGQPVGVVVSELGAWPLLVSEGLLAQDGSAWIVDASLDPPTILHIVNGQLQALRLVAPATVSAGEEAVQEELLWLLDSMPSHALSHQEVEKEDGSSPAIPNEGEQVIFLGRSQAFWQPFLETSFWRSRFEKADTGYTQVSEPQKLGLPDWAWVRPAGLAVAAQEGQARLLDFHGVGDFYGLVREWLPFWRVAGVCLLLLMVVWGGQEGVRYRLAQTQIEHFKYETAALFKKALPRVPVMLDPRLQLRQALSQAAPEGAQTLKMVEWLRLIQNKVGAESKVQWLRFRYDPGEVQLLGEVPSYKHLDQVQNSLKSLSLVREVRTEEAHIVAKTKNVQFRLKLL